MRKIAYNLRKLIRTELMSVLWFIIGVILSAVFSRFLDRGITNDAWCIITPLSATVLVLAITQISFAVSVRKDLNKMLEDLAKQSTVIVEPDFQVRDGESRCYMALLELVRSANNSIFIIPNPYREGAINTWELPPRENFLKGIEKKIVDKKKNNENFKYTRIQQVPKKHDNIKKYIGNTAWNHIMRVNSKKYNNVNLMYIENDEISGQMIIDGDTLIKFISGIDRQENKRLIAIAVLKDPNDNSIREYCNRVEGSLPLMSQFIPFDGE